MVTGDFQAKQKDVIIGSEMIADVNATISMADGNFHTFGVNEGTFAYGGFPINPADKTLFPRLAAVAGQYTKFRLLDLKLQFVSSAASTTTGNVLFAMAPNANTPVPTTQNQMSSMLAYRTMGAFGSNEIWPVPREACQQMYKIQNVQSPKTATDIQDTNTAAMLFIGVEGVEGGAALTLGKLYAMYSVEFSVPKLSTGSNASGNYVMTDMTAGTAVRFLATDLTDGRYETIYPTSTAGTYILRYKHFDQSLILVTASATAHAPVVSVSRMGTTYTTLLPVDSVGTTTCTYTFRIPAGNRYLRLAYSTSLTPTAGRLHMDAYTE